jgi:hypothetical protein
MKQFLLAAMLLSGTAMASHNKPLFIKEGIWRGVFTVNKTSIPFNFELKNTVFSLINGERRDEFQLSRIGDDSVYIKMNTYDAVLRGRVDAEGHISGEYRGADGKALLFSAEPDKNYRFVEPGKEVAPGHNLKGRWELQIFSGQFSPNRIWLLKQEGCKLTGVLLSLEEGSRELEGTVQGDEFELSGFTGVTPVYIKGKISNNGVLSGELTNGTFNKVKFGGVKNEKAELPDLNDVTYQNASYDIRSGRIAGKKVA